jgi:hypothetical protein
MSGNITDLHDIESNTLFNELLYNMLSALEGNIPIVYVDANGYATIGIGVLLYGAHGVASPNLDFVTQILATNSNYAAAADSIYDTNQPAGERTDTSNDNAAYAAFNRILGGNFSLTPSEGLALFLDVIPQRLTTAGGELGSPANLDVNEMLALTSLAYIGISGGSMTTDLDAGNRAAAWYEIRFDSNGNNLSDYAKRHYLDSQVFDLYGSDVDPTGTGAPNFSLVSPEGAFSEIDQIFEMYTAYLYPQVASGDPGIASYDNQWNAQVAVANGDASIAAFMSELSVSDSGNVDGDSMPPEQQFQVQTTQQALNPAYQYLINTYADNIAIPSPNGDYFNIYADPGSTDGGTTDEIVSPRRPNPTGYKAAAGNYIIIGSGTGQTIEGMCR